MLRRENSEVSESRKRTLRVKMEKSLNPLKESHASNAMDMDISKKECPNYLTGKGKVYATTLSDSDSSNSDSEESCDREGNYSTFMTIAPVESLDNLSLLVDKLRDHTEMESMGVVEESDVKDDERTVGLQETYNSLLEKFEKYARVAKAAIKKMKKVEEDIGVF